jgi:hypothetical protein
MKHNFLFFVTGALMIGTLSFQKSGNFSIGKITASTVHRNANGAAAGKTGAPGEQNCTACHTGTALDGSSENILTVLQGATPVTSYIPGQTYTVALAMASNPAKKGFQATALTSTDVMAGTFTAGSNTSVNGTAKKYANHTSTSNTSAIVLWGWSWTAPSSDVGPVTFYVATNKTNNNGNDSGDAIYLSQHVIGSSAGLVEDSKVEMNFSAGYNPLNKQLTLSFDALNGGDFTLNLVDVNGRTVYYQSIGKAIEGKNQHIVTLPDHLKEGMYFVNCFVGNRPMSAKVMLR